MAGFATTDLRAGGVVPHVPAGVRPQPVLRTWTGDVRSFGWFSHPNLGHMRQVWVYLPPSYATSARRFPVVYFQDGQNVFDAHTAFAGVEWRADETLEELAAIGTEAIAVAIANTPDRIDEYSPVTNSRHAGGRASAYLEFLVEELKPRIDAALRTQPDRDHTAIVGSSLGGLLALYAGVAAAARFGRVGALSPALDWGAYDIGYRYGASQQLPSRIWIDMGTAEAHTTSAAAQAVADLHRFAGVLRERGFTDDDSLHCEEVDGARHDEAAWAARLPRVLAFLLR